MHGKTVNAHISRLRRQLNEGQHSFSPADCAELLDFLNRGKALYDRYGGKIFVIGRVLGTPFCEDDEDFYDTSTQDLRHWNSNIYAEIGDLFCLPQPIDISGFNSFLLISRQSAITGVFGEDFARLKEIIQRKNNIPTYVRESVSTAIPLTKITHENWLLLSRDNRCRFFLESQFRSFYANYFLMDLGDQKTFFRECPCIRDGKRYFVDNVILFDGFFLPVEIKLNMKAERNLISQLSHYCMSEKIILDSKTGRVAPRERIYQFSCLLLDTNGVYLYNHNTSSIEQLCLLGTFQNTSDILMFRDTLRTALSFY